MLRTFKDLKVGQKAYQLSLETYALSRRFPPDERFGLTAQLRRAAVSVPSNIAEGCSRNSTRDYIRFLRVASGSLAEMETQLLLAKDLKLCSSAEMDRILESLAEVERMLRALNRSLKAKEREPK